MKEVLVSLYTYSNLVPVETVIVRVQSRGRERNSPVRIIGLFFRTRRFVWFLWRRLWMFSFGAPVCVRANIRGLWRSIPFACLVVVTKYQCTHPHETFYFLKFLQRLYKRGQMLNSHLSLYIFYHRHET
jgi:hypothetical protein